MLLATLFALAAIEVICRLVQSAPTYRDTAVPIQYDTNLVAPRYHERPFESAKPPGTFRIVALGDSFTAGWGIYPEDAWPHRLEERLEATGSETRYEVVNVGKPHWSTHDEAKFLAGHIDELAPDLVLLGWCLNDPDSDYDPTACRLERDVQRRSPSRLAARLHRTSFLFRRIWEGLESRRQRAATDAYYDYLYAGKRWSSATHALGRIETVLGERQVPLVVVVFPLFDSDIGVTYAHRRLHRQVANACDALGIPHLDLLPAFEGDEGRRLAVTPFTDAHPNELAQRIAADRILSYLRETCLLDPEAPGGSWPMPATR